MSAIPTQLDPQGEPRVFPDAPAPSRAIRRIAARQWRVSIILVMVTLVSLADLYLTLTYLQNGGMAEGNPVARWVMSVGCPWVLGVWKVALVGVTCGILFAFRRRASAEIAAWVCALVMGWLVFQWSTYIRDIDHELTTYPQLSEVSNWVAFDRN